MSLSHDIISEFVKVTNNNKEKPKEGTVYATIVQGSDGKYVKIDGSDLLTPAVTTTDIEDGERVTVMIKDHKATVTGNVTSPSASGNRVDKVVDTVTEQIGVFETVVADKVSTNELEAYKATIEYLVAGKAEIEDLEAINATIENLKVKDAEIENAVIDKATIEDLEAVNAKIENLKVKDAEIENAVVENLEATKADIQILNADFAQIKTLVSGNLTSDNILSFNITADKVTMEDAFIKDAMIANVNAAKINAGRINTNSVVIGSEDGGMSISGATQQFTDKNGNVRIQIGRDASDDFTFALYGEDGRGQLINQNGITASAISDGIIVNDMISDDASISGGKLDISSVITEINNDGSTTIKSNKIHLDGQNQSLEVAFNSLKSQVDTIQDVTIDGDLTSVVEQVQSNTSKIEVNASSINTLIAEDKVIKKQVTDLEGNIVETNNELSSKYASLNQNLEGFKTTVANTYATKSSVNDVKNNLESNYSTTSAMNSAIQQKVDAISASVSSTYATKNEVKTIDDNIKANYSTTEQMESAISVAKNEINLGVSKVYETKTEVSNKIGGAIDKVLIGGRNLIIRNTETKNYYIGVDGSLSKVDGFGVSDYIKVDSGGSLAFSKKDSPTTDDYFRWAWYGNDKTYINRAPNNSNKFIWVVPSGAAYVRISYPLDCYPKVERGTKHTDWTPAPEDVDTSINNAITTSNEYTDSQIKISKDVIELGVSQTYETKTSVTSKVNSAISTASSDATTKANNALSSAKSYADTKKTEAINSANTTLNNTIANYYTKTQTDSQINVAKNAITQSVANTYETKTDVTSKINGVNSSISSLTTRMTNAESKITDTAITNVVKQNFYTKNELTSGSSHNLINNGGFENGNTHWIRNGNFTDAKDIWYPYGNGTSWVLWLDKQWAGFFQSFNCKIGHTYSWSMDIYVEKGRCICGVEDVNQEWWEQTNGWQRMTGTFVATSTSHIFTLYASQDATIIHVDNIMVCEGSIPLPYQPSYIEISDRLQSAEQKITPDAITSVVGQSFYTKAETENAITSKGYATSTQLQQTADSFTYKFSQSGGYNLIRNGNPKPWKEQHWWVSGNGWWYREATDIGIQTLDTNEAYAGSSTIKVDPGKTYSLSCWVYAESNTKGTDVYFIGSANDDGGYTEIHHLFSSGPCDWTHVKKTFTVGSNINYGFIRIDNNGRKDTSNGGFTVVFFSEVLLVKGVEYYPQWSPNPNEVYDGIVLVDKDGIEVGKNNSPINTRMANEGFYVRRGNEILLSATSSGLNVSGYTTTSSLATANGTTINGANIRTGVLSSQNGNLRFNLDNGRMHLYDSGSLLSTVFTMRDNRTGVNGMGILARNNSFIGLGMGDNDDNTLYSPFIVLTGQTLGNEYKKGINIKETIHGHFCKASNLGLEWKDFKRSRDDYASIYSTNQNSSNSKLVVEIGNDYTSSFEIHHKLYTNSSPTRVATFRATGGSEYNPSGNAGIHFHQNLDMHGYRIWGASTLSAKDIEATNLLFETRASAFLTDEEVSYTAPITLRANMEYFGSAEMEDGGIVIDLPLGFMHSGYAVIISPHKNGNYSIEKSDDCFTVHGDIESFDYIIKGEMR